MSFLAQVYLKLKQVTEDNSMDVLIETSQISLFKVFIEKLKWLSDDSDHIFDPS